MYLLLLPLLAIVSCDDGFESVNSNPNEPEEVDAGVLMTSATRASISSTVDHSFLFSNVIAQLSIKVVLSEIDRYQFSSLSTLWFDQYRALRDFRDAELIAAENENYATQAASIIMQTNAFYTLTMTYGDIPYTEAIAGIADENYTPTYTSQEDIFKGEGSLQDRLQEANALLDQAISSGQTVNGDIIFDGNPENWKKLSNVLQLRILLHLSNKEDVSTEMANIVSDGPLFENNEDNAVLNFLGSFPNDFPTFPKKQGEFDSVRFSKQALDAFEKYDDPRLGRYARPINVTDIETFNSSNANYSGGENGDASGGSCDKGGSRLGSRYYDYPGHPVGDTEANGIIATYSEQELIIAEAISNPAIDLSIAGTAASHYKEGIKASMDYYNVDYDSFGYTSFNDFYDNSTIAHGGSPTLDEIKEQKWLATFFHGMEPYFDTRRMVYEANNGNGFETGQVPFLENPCQNINNDNMPTRFLYPGNSISLNNESYQEAIDRFEGDENTQNGVIWIIQ